MPPVLETAIQEYESKLKTNSKDSKTLYKLGWRVEELSKLNQEGRHITTELKVLKDGISSSQRIDFNRKVYTIGKSLTSFIKGRPSCTVCSTVLFIAGSVPIGCYRHCRTAATHMFAILISADDRKHKPYALPVQMVSYVGMRHDTVRELINRLVQRMTNMHGNDCNGYVRVFLTTQVTCIKYLYLYRVSVQW